MADDDRRAGFVAAIRRLADLFETTDLKVPCGGINVLVYCRDANEADANVRALGGLRSKYTEGAYSGVRRQLGTGVLVDVYTSTSDVTRRASPVPLLLAGARAAADRAEALLVEEFGAEGARSILAARRRDAGVTS